MKKAWLVINTFIHSVKFMTLYDMLSTAFKIRNVDLKIKRAEDITLEIGGKIKNKPDFAIFWDKDCYLAQRLEGQGIKLFNNGMTIIACDNKILMYEILAMKGIRIPRTFAAPKTFEGFEYNRREFIATAAKELGLPMVIKEAYGSFGEQVYLVNSIEEANELVDKFGAKDFLMQEYIASSKGRDVRVNVVGGKAIVSMLRENENDFRSNISHGGTGKKFNPGKKFTDLAVKAAKAIGVDFAGVDVLFGPNGEPIICELNSNPQFGSTYKCTGVNLADAIADHVLKHL